MKRPRFPMDYYVTRLRGREQCSPGISRALLVKHLAFLMVKEESTRKQGDKVRADRIMGEAAALAQAVDMVAMSAPEDQIANMKTLFARHLERLRALPWAKLSE